MTQVFRTAGRQFVYELFQAGLADHDDFLHVVKALQDFYQTAFGVPRADNAALDNVFANDKYGVLPCILDNCAARDL